MEFRADLTLWMRISKQIYAMRYNLKFTVNLRYVIWLSARFKYKFCAYYFPRALLAAFARFYHLYKFLCELGWFFIHDRK